MSHSASPDGTGRLAGVRASVLAAADSPSAPVPSTRPRRGAVRMNIGAEAIAFERAARYLSRFAAGSAEFRRLTPDERNGFRRAIRALRERSRDYLLRIREAA